MNSTILLRIDWGWLNERPFASDVWGTVSDWVMICITTVSLGVIWWTLKSQLKLQRMEFLSKSILLKPLFTFQTIEDKALQHQGVILIQFKLKLTQNSCIFNSYSINDNSFKELQLKAISPHTENLPYELTVGEEIIVSCAYSKDNLNYRLPTNPGMARWIFTFYFTDVLENKYKQCFIFDGDNSNMLFAATKYT